MGAVDTNDLYYKYLHKEPPAKAGGAAMEE
jgi:hypothetical protein